MGIRQVLLPPPGGCAPIVNPIPMTVERFMKRDSPHSLVLFGCGGHAREVAEIALHAQRSGAGAALLGFLDEDASRHGSQVDSFPVLGGFEWLEQHCDEVRLVVAIGDIPSRQRVVTIAESLGALFGTVVSPLASLSQRCQIGQGSMIFPRVVVSTNVTIGNHVILGLHSSVSHDCVVGDFAFLCPGSRATGGVTIGTGTLLGTNASVLPGRSVGAASQIGGGGCVITDIPAGVTAVGVPARIVRPV